jgi:dolichol-phosphate mannosyltransferase
MRVLVCVPTYNEVENVEELLTRLRAAAPDVDVLVIDDNSPDGTADVAERIAAALGRIEVLRRPAKRGLGSAYRAGFTIGIERGYDALVQMDADLSHDPDALPGLIAAVDAGADLAIGSRYVPGGHIPHWPWYRRALSKWGNRYASWILRIPVRDGTAGYRCYRAAALAGIDYASTHADGYGFQIECSLRVSRWGGTIAELPITFTDRVRGHSKMPWTTIVEEMSMVTWWGLRDRVRALRRDRGDEDQPPARRASAA